MSDVSVSIITPSYESEDFIIQTIESVFAQTHENWEMIIVDDCSPDKSNDIIEAYCKKDKRIKLIKLEQNSGPAIARNRAIKEAKGRYIAFLDADDMWLPKKLEKQVEFMQQHDLAFTYTAYKLIDEGGNEKGEFVPKAELSYSDLLKTNSIGCLTAVYDVEKLGKVFMPNILKRQDYGLWLKILSQMDRAKGLLKPLAIYRLRENSVSSNKLQAAYYHWKILRDVQKLSLLKSVYYFAHYAIAGVLKY